MTASGSDRHVAWRVAVLCLVCAIAVGVAARVWLFVAVPALTGDELMLHWSVIRRGVRELSAPLDHGQMAPLLFLWLQRGVVAALGPGEQAARVGPLLAGLAAIPLTAAVVTACSTRRAGLVAAALAAVSPTLLQYANQAKQYSLEAAATALVAWVAVSVTWPRRSVAGVAALTAASLAALLMSIPALFVVAAAWTATLLHARRHPTPARLWTLMACGGAVSGLTFAGLYARLYASAGHDGFMQQYWRARYLSSQTSWSDVASLALPSLTLPVFGLDDTLPAGVAVIAFTAAIVGIGHLVSHRRWPEAALLAGPLALTMFASLAGRWPLATRLLAFAAPLLIALVALGLDRLADRWPRGPAAALPAAALAVLVLSSLRADVYQARHPSSDNRDVVATITTRAGTEPVYVYAGGILEWLYYSEDWRAPDRARIDTWLGMAARLGTNPGNSAPRGRPVARDGWEMALRHGGRLELMGIDSGTTSDSAGYHGLPPDAGWADNEADRIAATGAPQVFLFIARYRQPPIDALLASLARRGYEVVEASDGDTRMYRLARRQHATPGA